MQVKAEIDQASNDLKRSVCEDIAIKDGDSDEIDTVHGESRRQSDGIGFKDGELQEGPTRLVKGLELNATVRLSKGNKDKRSPVQIKVEIDQASIGFERSVCGDSATRDGDPDKIDTVHEESRRQSGGMSTRDGALQERDDRQSKDAAITKIYDKLPAVKDDMLLPAVINANEALSCDAVAPYRVTNLKIEVGTNVIEWENFRGVDPDSKRFSHHHKNETDMGYIEEHEQSAMVAAETDTVGIDRYSANCNPLKRSCGEKLWLHLDRFKDQYARSLSHMWIGSFREANKGGDDIVRLDIDGNPYMMFSMVHVSKLNQVKMFPDRPIICLSVYEIDRVDFHEVLLPNDSWEGGREDSKFEEKRTEDVRSGRKPRVGRVHCPVGKYWKGSSDPTWIDEADVNCVDLSQKCDRDRASRNRFKVRQLDEAASRI